jgi:hypothetical protein
MSNYIVSAVPKNQTVYVAGIQGPAGAIVPNQFTINADAAMVSNKVVAATLTGCEYADNSAFCQVLGFTKSSAQSGALVMVTADGEMTGFTGLTQGQPIYLGSNGNITQVIPTSGFVQQLGLATSATSINIRLSVPITLA